MLLLFYRNHKRLLEQMLAERKSEISIFRNQDEDKKSGSEVGVVGLVELPGWGEDLMAQIRTALREELCSFFLDSSNCFKDIVSIYTNKNNTTSEKKQKVKSNRRGRPRKSLTPESLLIADELRESVVARFARLPYGHGQLLEGAKWNKTRERWATLIRRANDEGDATYESMSSAARWLRHSPDVGKNNYNPAKWVQSAHGLIKHLDAIISHRANVESRQSPIELEKDGKKSLSLEEKLDRAERELGVDKLVERHGENWREVLAKILERGAQ